MITVSSYGDLSYINAAVGALQDAKTYIGIPERATHRKQSFIGPAPKAQMTNAGLLYIHTNGSPRWNIPPRPVIEPAIKANQTVIENDLHNVATLMLNGKKREAKRQLKMVGTFAANAAKAWFTDPRNGWAQDSPLTIRRKLSKLKRKGFKANKRYLNAMTVLSLVNRYRPQYGSTPLDNINTPLIDTGELRRSITHVESL